MHTYDLLLSELDREVLRAADNGSLGSAVPGETGAAHNTSGRGNVDDGGGLASSSRLLEDGDRNVHRVEDGLEVNVDAEVEVGLGRRQHRLGLVSRAGVVDDIVEAAVRVLRDLDDVLPVTALRDIACCQLMCEPRSAHLTKVALPPFWLISSVTAWPPCSF